MLEKLEGDGFLRSHGLSARLGPFCTVGAQGFLRSSCLGGRLQSLLKNHNKPEREVDRNLWRPFLALILAEAKLRSADVPEAYSTWLLKVCCLLRYPKYLRPYKNREPKRNRILHNLPYAFGLWQPCMAARGQ